MKNIFLLQNVQMLRIFLIFSILTAILVGCGSYNYLSTQGSSGMVGAYSGYRNLTSEERNIFDKATHGTRYSRYSPVGVSTQVVAGTNYRFHCKKKNGKYHEVTIYQPLPGQGEPRITSAKKTNKRH